MWPHLSRHLPGYSVQSSTAGGAQISRCAPLQWHTCSPDPPTIAGGEGSFQGRNQHPAQPHGWPDSSCLASALGKRFWVSVVPSSTGIRSPPHGRSNLQAWEKPRGEQWVSHKPNLVSTACHSNSMLSWLQIFESTNPKALLAWQRPTGGSFDMCHLLLPHSKQCSLTRTAPLGLPPAGLQPGGEVPWQEGTAAKINLACQGNKRRIMGIRTGLKWCNQAGDTQKMKQQKMHRDGWEADR